MSDRFRIYKDAGDDSGPWYLDYPDGFDEHTAGEHWDTFADAVEAFVEASQRQCPMCGRGAVVDTDFGWRCEACGCYDVAVGCEAPR